MSSNNGVRMGFMYVVKTRVPGRSCLLAAAAAAAAAAATAVAVPATAAATVIIIAVATVVILVITVTIIVLVVVADAAIFFRVKLRCPLLDIAYTWYGTMC